MNLNTLNRNYVLPIVITYYQNLSFQNCMIVTRLLAKLIAEGYWVVINNR